MFTGTPFHVAVTCGEKKRPSTLGEMPGRLSFAAVARVRGWRATCPLRRTVLMGIVPAGDPESVSPASSPLCLRRAVVITRRRSSTYPPTTGSVN